MYQNHLQLINVIIFMTYGHFDQKLVYRGANQDA